MPENPKFPTEINLHLEKVEDLKYGENPHQPGAIYLFEDSPLARLKQLHGTSEPSATNITDINAGILSIQMFKEPAAVVIKHNSPCGIALGENPYQALSRAIQADTLSAFGGIVVANTPIDIETARAISEFKEENRGQMDVIAAPDVSEDALDLFKKVRKNTAIYSFGELSNLPVLEYKPIIGGFVVQEGNTNPESSFDDWTVATDAQPTEQQLAQMRVAWKFITRIKSNTIIVMDPELPMTRGIGAGQTSRVGSVEIALNAAGERAKGAVLASDSFFPFSDSVEKAAAAGIGAIIQQGGSIGDKFSIEAANKAGIPMVMTHQRAFWH